MKNDPYLSYWRECVGEMLCEIGLYEKVTPEQLETAAEFVQESHDQYGMAFGHECIPNPLKADVEELQRKRKDDERKSSEREDALKSHIASKYNVPVWVSVRDGRVEVERQR